MGDNTILNNPFFSIIVPVYNTGRYLEYCINSVVNQKFCDYELILINDGSTDNSMDICNYYSDNYDQIIAIDKMNSGVSETRNVGIDAAKGKYIVFLDSDDFVTRDFLNILYNNIVVSCADVLFFNFYISKDGNSYEHKLSHYFSVPRKLNKDHSFRSIFDKMGFGGYSCNKVYLKSLISGISFDRNIYFLEDEVFNAEVLNRADKIYCIPDSIYIYRQRKDSMVNSGLTEKGLTYFDALDMLEKIVPYEFKKNVYLLRKIALISFGSKSFLHNKEYFYRMKKKYAEQANIYDNCQIIGAFEKIVIKLANKSFISAVILFKAKSSIVKTRIYYLYKNEL